MQEQQTESYYEILGVAETATQDEIKKAYRKKSFEFHPDRNNNDPVSEKKFKAINEANQTLSDPDKRSQYDRKRSGGGQVEFDEEGIQFNVEDLFGLFGKFRGSGFPFFGRQRNHREPPVEALPIQLHVNLSLSEVFKPQQKEVEFQYLSTCKDCKGVGYSQSASSTHKLNCEDCGGSGNIHQVNPYKRDSGPVSKPCKTCEGKGHKLVDPCSVCKMNKIVSGKTSEKFDIPVGVQDGMGTVINGYPLPDGSKRNIQLLIHVSEHEEYHRQGNDLILVKELSFGDAVLGCEYELDHIDGTKLKITIPAGIQHGTQLRVQGKGTPFIHQEMNRGDLYVIGSIKIPTQLTEEQKQYIEKYNSMFVVNKNAN